jgi:SAM domain (Sterile alpha motif)
VRQRKECPRKRPKTVLRQDGVLNSTWTTSQSPYQCPPICWTRRHDGAIILASHVERDRGCGRVASQSRLAQYEEKFRDNKIDADVLLQLTADDLRDIGVAARLAIDAGC